MYGVMLILC